MTSTPVTILTFRTGQSADRPFPASLTTGQLALSFGATEPGLYFLDSASDIRKIGGAQYGTNAPNSTPNGQSGNSVGELWVDDTTNYNMRVWNGSAWVEIGAGFATLADTATTATTANFATTAGTATNATNATTANFATTAGSCTGEVSTLFSGSLPTVGDSGSLAFDTVNQFLYVSDGTSWNKVLV
tara:strand:- start:9760 stop:10320 length:561 start_codon:yes stop_codon:yes gene_type:complete